MFLDLQKIGPEGLRLEREVRVADLAGAGGETVRVLAARVEGEIAKAGRVYSLDGRFDSTVETACSRCLEPFRIAIGVGLRLNLTPLTDGAEGREPGAAGTREIDEEDEERFDCPGGQLDLVHLAEEQIYLGLPLKPVCSEGCRGLCPQCGSNRNATECGCRSETIDPRLAPLLALRKPDQDR